MKLFLLSLLSILCLTGCSISQSQAQKKEPQFKPWSEVAARDSAASSTSYTEPKLIGTITDKSLPEVSGIVASRLNPGVFWVHNDSGDQARIYAIDPKGELLAQFDVPNAKNEDWEDIAIGPGKDGQPALYIEDAGNNSRSRDDVVIYRVREPKLGTEKKATTEPAEAFPFKFPDGKHDCEAIFVNPENGQIFLITKTMQEDCGVYRFPLPLKASGKIVLEKVSGKKIQKIQQLRLVTGASCSPDGTRLAIRTYFAAFEFQREVGKPFETIFDNEPMSLAMPLMKQSEAVAYTADGKSIVTTSEKIPAPIFQITRK